MYIRYAVTWTGLTLEPKDESYLPGLPHRIGCLLTRHLNSSLTIRLLKQWVQEIRPALESPAGRRKQEQEELVFWRQVSTLTEKLTF